MYFNLENKPTEEQIKEMFEKNNSEFQKLANFYYKKDKIFYENNFKKFYTQDNAVIIKNEKPKQQTNPSINPPIMRSNIWFTHKPNVICPHCQNKGEVYTGQSRQKSGISGGKATGAILTGGLSLLATGLSKKVWVTYAYCKNCEMIWQV
jgi:hypothetical protein